MADLWPFTSIIGIIVGLLHSILFLFFMGRPDKDRGLKLALLYLGFSVLWITAVTLADLQTVFIPLVTDPANQLIPALVTILVVLQLVLASVLLEIPHLPIIAGVGGGWAGLATAATIYWIVAPDPDFPLYQVIEGGWAVLTLALVVLVSISLFRSRLALHRNRALYWMAAAVSLSGGQAMTLLPAGPLRILGLLLHLPGLVALVRGTTSYWLPNVKAMLRSVLRFALLFIVSAGLLLGVVFGAEMLTNRLPFSSTVLVVVLTVLAALIYLPVYRLLQRLVDRLLEGVGFDPTQALRDYSQTIGTILDLEQLAEMAVKTVVEVLDVRRGALLVTTVTERGGLEMQPVRGLGEVTEEPFELEPISPILARIRENEPLFQYEVEHHPVLREAAKKERDWLRSLEMEIYLPIRSQGELTGLLALGPQGTGEPYSIQAVEFLTTLGHQTGVALQNASLFEGLRALNAHVTELNENLRTAYERLERLDKAKTDFLSIASHELRTPLTQVRGYIDILTELSAAGALAPEQVLRIAGNISGPVRRLEGIINAMLDSSRIDTEGLSLQFVPTTLASTMRMAVEAWSHAFQERGLNLRVVGMDDIRPIYADSQRLFQAFSNILSNAIKFTPDGGQITVEAHPLDEEHFKVEISDTGIGISKSDLELIFEKFYRVGSVSLHSTGEYKFKGAGPGLGLPIARGVIEGHGGCIWVESEGYDEERCPGSVFHVVLPYKAHRGECRWRPPTTERFGLPVLEMREDVF
ncbi:MAG: GAF domain-containing sensor histidine kinase [Anaerolineae bacterium]|nr:GAF domain-containing sensor histidine kinase [Anaerolineae bacterium]